MTPETEATYNKALSVGLDVQRSRTGLTGIGCGTLSTEDAMVQGAVRCGIAIGPDRDAFMAWACARLGVTPKPKFVPPAAPAKVVPENMPTEPQPKKRMMYYFGMTFVTKNGDRMLFDVEITGYCTSAERAAAGVLARYKAANFTIYKMVFRERR